MKTAGEHMPDYHSFVNDKLSASGFRITAITEELMKNRLDDFLSFVNTIRHEYSELYGWRQETKEYLLNGLVDKWKYSFAVFDQRDEICLLNFTSVYNGILHYHCTYTGIGFRNRGFAKLHTVKLCQIGIDNGFTRTEGYWPKKNNKSIILYLKMGWNIDKVVESKDCVLMSARLEDTRNRTVELINKSL